MDRNDVFVARPKSEQLKHPGRQWLRSWNSWKFLELIQFKISKDFKPAKLPTTNGKDKGQGSRKVKAVLHNTLCWNKFEIFNKKILVLHLWMKTQKSEWECRNFSAQIWFNTSWPYPPSVHQRRTHLGCEGVRLR